MGASLLGFNYSATVNSALTRQGTICGVSGWNNLTESVCRHRFSQAGTATKLWSYIATNTLDSGTTTVKLRINSANGNNTLSIASGATGEFEDASSSDTISAGDLVNLQIITSGTSGSIGYRSGTIVYTPSGTSNFKLLSESVSSPISQGASTTNYIGAFGTNTANTTEANAQWKTRSSGTLRNGYVSVSANSRSDSTTLKSRVNGADGNISVSISASATGDFADTTNTDAISDGDLICWSLTTGGGTGTISFRTYALELDASSGGFEMACHRDDGHAANTVTTRYFAVQGGLPTGTFSQITTESNQYQNSALAFTSSNLRIYVSANTWDNAGTLRTRINAGNGSQSVSITAATTGWFEDASNTDSIVAGDLINTSLATTGTGSMTIHTIALTGATSSPQTLSPDPADYDWTAELTVAE